MNKEGTKVCLAKKYGKNQGGFFMLQVLPALLATVTVVVTLVACYGRCVQTMFRHNRILAAQAAGNTRQLASMPVHIVFQPTCMDLPPVCEAVQGSSRRHRADLPLVGGAWPGVFIPGPPATI